MNAGDTNPYAPPPSPSEDAGPSSQAFPELQASGVVPFLGQPDDRDLREFLRTEEHVGCGFVVLLGICLGSIALVLVFQDAGWAAIGLGIAGLFVILAVVNTLFYRRLVFENANPHWRHSCRGELRAQGIYVDRGDSRTFLRWDWFADAVIAERWVAFLPASDPMQPLLLTRSMLDSADGWTRLLDAAGSLSNQLDASHKAERPQGSIRIMREPDRPRSVDVPSDAIAFSGLVRVLDFDRLPKAQRHRRKPLRSHLVVAGLILCGALIIAGISELLFDRFATLPLWLVLYVVLAGVGILMRRRRRGRNGGDVIYFLNGFATQRTVVTDLSITTTELDWSALNLVMRSDDTMVLKRRGWSQFLVVRRDMFADESGWRRFRQDVDQQVASSDHQPPQFRSPASSP